MIATPISPANMELHQLIANTQQTQQYLHLDYLSLIKAEGNDVEAFLQGQFSNDVTRIGLYSSQLNAYCTPKGRALAIFQLFKDKDCFWILIPRDISEGFINRLRMFVMRARVTFAIADLSTYFGMLGEFPTGHHEEMGHIFELMGTNTHQPKRNLIIPHDHSETELNAINDSHFWKLMDIQAGIPQIYSQTVEACIPQNVNLDLIDGINFKKGCYPGQEIVARLKYLGKSKQRLAISMIRNDSPINPGDEIYAEDRPDQKAGLVIDAVKTAESIYQASVMIPITKLEQNDLHLRAVSGPILSALPLPYDMPLEDS